MPVRMAEIQKADNKVVAARMQSSRNLNSLLMRMQNGSYFLHFHSILQ